MDDFLTAHDVAKLAGVTSAAVRLWADRGKLPVRRTAGGVRLFVRDDVAKWLTQRDRERHDAKEGHRA